jgi:hypothetical protein
VVAPLQPGGGRLPDITIHHKVGIGIFALPFSTVLCVPVTSPGAERGNGWQQGIQGESIARHDE